MKRIFAFLLLLFAPTFVWAEEEQNILDDHFLAGVVLESSYRAFYEHKVNIEAARAICKRYFNIATNSKWSPVKWYLNENNKCYIIDKSICDSNNENIIYEITPYIARYYYNKIEKGKDICEEQIIQYSDCRQYWKERIALEQAQIKWEDTKETDIQCSNTEDYCIVNHPCTGIEDMFSENCYMCVAMYKLEVNDKCQLTNVNPYSLKSSWTTNPKTLNDFDKDCNSLTSSQ